MNESTLKNLLPEIPSPDWAAHDKAQARLDSLTKPLGSLGRLEELAAHYVAMTGKTSPPPLNPTVFTLVADHGITAEGISAYPQTVTAQMVKNFLQGIAGVNVLARHTDTAVCVVDMGVADDLGVLPGLITHKIAKGTKNFAQEPAMTEEQAWRCIQIGMDLVKDACTRGTNLVGVGEMGIGNTTASAAIVSVLTGQSVEKVTGRGTGVNDRQFRHKISVIEQALLLHRPSSLDAMDVLVKVGGFEIGGIVGIILGAAACRVPVVLDGFITGAGALLAVALKPECRDYLIASHLSQEPGHRTVLDYLQLEPLLDLRLRLGEGTGACLAITLVQAAIKIYTEMATFDETGVDGAISLETGKGS